MTSQQSADIELTKYRLDRIAFKRIAEIDAMWEHWVVAFVDERADLVNGINARRGKIAHRHELVAKTD